MIFNCPVLQRIIEKKGSHRSLQIVFLILFVLVGASALYSDLRFSERENLGIVLVIDRSGSMGYLNYLNPAKQRAQVFIGLMENGDQVGVVSYNETADVNYSMTTITGDVIKAAAQNAVNAIQSEGNTSIGSGLLRGRSQLNSSSASGQKAMILLSDGLDNTSPFAINVVPNIPSHMDVYTIALGPQSDQALMQWIANQTGGSYYYLPTTVQLQQIYDTINGSLRDYQQYYSQSGTIQASEIINQSVGIDSGTGFIHFTVTSDEEFSGQLTSLDFVLQSPSGMQITPSNISDSGIGELIEGFAYRSYRIPNPSSGSWQMIITNNSSDDELQYDLTVSGSSEIKMQQVFSQSEYTVNEPLPLTVDITDQGVPVSNCIVTADIIHLPEVNRAGSTDDSFIQKSLTMNPASVNRNTSSSATGFSQPRTNTEVSSRTETVLYLTETEPGRYETLFYDTLLPGTYNVEITAQIENDGLIVSRKQLASFYFSLPAPLNAPILLQPENYAQSLPVDVVFSWTPVLNAESYQIQIADNHEILFDITDIMENSITINLPDHNSEYIWWIRALADGQEGNWSNQHHFATGTPGVPLPPSLDAFTNADSIVLNWDFAQPDQFHGNPTAYKIYRNGNHSASVNSSDNSFTDTTVYPGESYCYYITVLYESGSESIPSNRVTVIFTDVESNEEPEIITVIRYNYPNPFNPETKIVFSLAESGNVRIRVFDIGGRLVNTLLDGFLQSGEHSVIWEGRNAENRPVPSGAYIVEMTVLNRSSHRKILLLK